MGGIQVFTHKVKLEHIFEYKKVDYILVYSWSLFILQIIGLITSEALMKLSYYEALNASITARYANGYNDDTRDHIL